MPAALNRCRASSIAAFSPDNTNWSGALWLAITTESPHSCDPLADPIDRCRHRTHRPVAVGRRLGHQRTTRARDQKRGLLAENAGGTQRADLAEAVSTDGDRRNAQRADHGEQAQAVRANPRLRPLGPGQFGRLLRTFVIRECRFRPDNLVQVAIGVQVLGASEFPTATTRARRAAGCQRPCRRTGCPDRGTAVRPDRLVAPNRNSPLGELNDAATSGLASCGRELRRAAARRFETLSATTARRCGCAASYADCVLRAM